MQFAEHTDLKPYNSFGIHILAKYFANICSIDDLNAILTEPVFQQEKQLVLGGGSNILFTKDYDGLVIKNEIDFISVIEEDARTVLLKAGAGVNWHRFVLYCIENNLAGLENLSLIPGCVGAAPMQNIGAYGVEVKDCIESVETMQIKDRAIVLFSNTDCRFGYRESIFKNAVKGQFIITAVNFRLNKVPVFNTSYGAIETELQKMGIKDLSIKAISDAVIRIRESKLPDPAKIGNAGSFFKNPTVSSEIFNRLKETHPGMPGYKNELAGTAKLAAGWMIEQCGFKGYREGDAGCHALQALVLVNYGNATGLEIYRLSEKIMESVFQKFSVALEREVNII
jgi:UDP-N-acetylmuramate dehydrogenase